MLGFRPLLPRGYRNLTAVPHTTIIIGNLHQKSHRPTHRPAAELAQHTRHAQRMVTVDSEPSHNTQRSHKKTQSTWDGDAGLKRRCISSLTRADRTHKSQENQPGRRIPEPQGSLVAASKPIAALGAINLPSNVMHRPVQSSNLHYRGGVASHIRSRRRSSAAPLNFAYISARSRRSTWWLDSK